MNESVISIRTGDLVREFPRRKLFSMIEGEPTEWNYWSLKSQLGVVARSGNTDQNDLNMYMFIRREASQVRLDLSYTGNYGTSLVQSWVDLADRL